YDDKTITYDKQGRPTNYLGKTMTWDNTGHLTVIDNTSNGTIRYTYLSDGQRHTKTVNGKTTTYHYNNGMLLSEQTGDETLRYYYDAAGKVTSFTYKKGSNAEVGYFYTRNLQGDIIAIYRNSDSALIGTYEYDLWGRLISKTEATKGIDTNGILAKNPFRYRGYYYDTETGFYNLNARYYDPEIRRFISPDDMIASVGTSVQGHNLFAYCFNNPVNMADPSGHWPREITAGIATVAAIVAGAGLLVGAPIVAIPAASVALAASAGYALQTAHYDIRKMLNTGIPVDRNAADLAEWVGPPNSPSAACHQYTAKDGENVKYVSPDGHREAVYDSQGNLVLDSRDIGTYNFWPSGTLNDNIGHFFCDIVPWIVFGNDDDPGPIINEINRFIK
ncbi:MAG: RHS repeat-associated core domain-containing protein, partial [Acetatifactor sp.]|nr:RHS repeat-associated core domain-containing protein [Acetatifactor sp.]